MIIIMSRIDELLREGYDAAELLKYVLQHADPAHAAALINEEEAHRFHHPAAPGGGYRELPFYSRIGPIERPGCKMRVPVRNICASRVCIKCGDSRIYISHRELQRHIADLPILDIPVELVLTHKRFCCRTCGKSFAQHDPHTGLRKRLTKRLVHHIENELNAGRGVLHISMRCGVSASTVIGIGEN